MADLDTESGGGHQTAGRDCTDAEVKCRQTRMPITKHHARHRQMKRADLVEDNDSDHH